MYLLFFHYVTSNNVPSCRLLINVKQLSQLVNLCLILLSFWTIKYMYGMFKVSISFHLWLCNFSTKGNILLSTCTLPLKIKVLVIWKFSLVELSQMHRNRFFLSKCVAKHICNLLSSKKSQMWWVFFFYGI